MGLMAGIGGMVGGLSGLFGGGGANSVQLPQMFQMPNMGSAAQNAFTGIGQLGPFTGAGYNMLGPSSQAFQTLFNNQGSGSLMGGANTAMGLGQNAALTGYGTGAGLIGMGQSMIPGAQAVLNMGLDPQSQLYNYAQNQNTQQSQANAAAAGLGTSPYGVGLTNQSNNLFNMGWENQQLGRAAQGLGAYGQAMGQSGALQNTGAGMMNAAPGQYMSASSMPFQAQSAIGAGQQQGISNYLGNMGTSANLYNMPFSDYMQYLGVGNQSNATANQNAALALQQNQQNFNQQMAFGSMLGGSMYGLGNMMGYGGGNSMLGSMFNGSFGMPNFVNQSFVNGSPGTPSYSPLQQSILAGYG